MDNVRLAINYLIENGHKMVENNNNYAVQSIKLAIEALEKQIPKNPKKMTYLLFKEAGWEYECPCCGLAVGRNDKYEISEERGYCESCGQALDWEVKE